MLITSDSPVYLFAVGKREKAFEVLKKMASWNGNLPVFLNHLHLQNKDTKDKKKKDEGPRESHSLAAGLREDSNLRFNFVIMLMIWCITSSSYFINLYQIKLYRGELFTKMLSLNIAEFISILISKYWYQRVGFNKVMGTS